MTPSWSKSRREAYHLVFEPRQAESAMRPMPLLESPPPRVAPAAAPSTWRFFAIALLLRLIASLAAPGKSAVEPQADGSSCRSGEVRNRAAGGILVALHLGHGRALGHLQQRSLVGRPETGMRYYNSSRNSKVSVYDHYTGVERFCGFISG